MRVRLKLQKVLQNSRHGSYIWRLYTQMKVELDLPWTGRPFEVTDVLVDTGSPYTIIPAMHWDPFGLSDNQTLERMNVPIGGGNRICAVANATISFFDQSARMSPKVRGNVLLTQDDHFNMTILGMDFLESVKLVCNVAITGEQYLEFPDYAA